MTIRCSIEQVGPTEADEMLKRNDRNRRTKWRQIDKYARDMADGKWVLNGETIVVADSGRLLNGQHRLLAIIKAEATIQVIVVRGVPEAAFATMDQGSKRTVGDVLTIRGEENANTLGATAVNIWRWEQFPDDRLKSSAVPTQAEIADLIETHSFLREAVKFTARHRVTGLSGTRAATLFFLFAQVDTADAGDFFLSLETGANISERSPILKLRELLINNYTGKRKLDQGELFAVAIKAWNLYRRNREVPATGLRWRSQGPAAESYPIPE